MIYSRTMTQERFEWLEIPEEPAKKKKSKKNSPDAVMGKRCPQCNWLEEETAMICFRCGYRYNVDQQMAARIQQLGVSLPPRIIETRQNLENFFRIHGRVHPPGPMDQYQLRLTAEQLRLSRGFDQLICLEDISVDHYEHQLETALRALRDMRGRALLADEVGLGKTIEAGIVMKELIERGLVRTVLVLTPASLTEQWREELSFKFGEEFTRHGQHGTVAGGGRGREGRWIVSLDRAKLDRHSERILGREYDLLVVDEAHKLKNRSTHWPGSSSTKSASAMCLCSPPRRSRTI
jgi:hypothetical protein